MATSSDVSLAFFLWNERSQSCKDLFFITAPKTTMLQGTLGDLRRVLAVSPQVKQYALYPFCTDKGALLPDVWHIRNSVRLYGVEMQLNSLMSFYIRQPSVSESAVDARVDSRTTFASLSMQGEPQTALSTGTNIPDPFASTSVNNLQVWTLGESEWALIARNNTLFNGFVIDRREGPFAYHPVPSIDSRKTLATVNQRKPALPSTTSSPYRYIPINEADTKSSLPLIAMGICNALRAAFQFKLRNISSTTLTTEPIDETIIPLRIPDFIVNDSSYAKTFQVNNDLQESLAACSFAWVDINTCLGGNEAKAKRLTDFIGANGNIFGYPICTTAGYGSAWEKTAIPASAPEYSQISTSYTFPQVRLNLDEGCLELTLQCKEDLSRVQDRYSLERFLNTYGEFYSTQVDLGGRLFALVHTTLVDGQDYAAKKKAIVAAAKASLSPVPTQAFVNMPADGDRTEQQPARGFSCPTTFSWSASGGDPMLSNDPNAWFRTVAPYYNWRIVEQSKPLHLIDLIGRMPGYEKIPNYMSNLADVATQPHDRDRFESQSHSQSESQETLADVPLSPPVPPRKKVPGRFSRRRDDSD